MEYLELPDDLSALEALLPEASNKVLAMLYDLAIRGLEERRAAGDIAGGLAWSLAVGAIEVEYARRFMPVPL